MREVERGVRAGKTEADGIPPACLLPSFPASLLPSLPASRLTRPLGCSPESSQSADVRRVPQLLEGSLPDLADAFPGDPEERADLFQGQGLGALFQAVVQRQDFPLPRGEMALEDAVDELALEAHVRHLLDLHPAGTGHPLAERTRASVLTLHWSIQRNLSRAHAVGRANVVYRVIQRDCDLLVGGLPPQLLSQKALGARHSDQSRILIQGNAHAAGLLCQRLEHRLTDPPNGV